MDSLSNSIHNLAGIYRNGTHLNHFAIIGEGKTPLSTMPLTPFVYDYFLYNKLFSVNWEQSVKDDHVVRYPFKGKNKVPERARQKKFEEFLMNLARQNPDALYEGFLPLANMSLEGDWTRIVPDDDITLERGNRFFKTDLPGLQELVRNSKTHEQQLAEVFKQIEQCREFVYDVRNDIFHSMSFLGVIEDITQKKRVEVYHSFLRCLISSFFLLASDHVPGTFGDDARTGNTRTSSTP